jgi:hypothetical protein
VAPQREAIARPARRAAVRAVHPRRAVVIEADMVAVTGEGDLLEVIVMIERRERR